MKKMSLATNGTRGKRPSTRAIERICQEQLATGKAHVLAYYARPRGCRREGVGDPGAARLRERGDDPALPGGITRGRNSALAKVKLFCDYGSEISPDAAVCLGAHGGENAIKIISILVG